MNRREQEKVDIATLDQELMGRYLDELVELDRSLAVELGPAYSHQRWEGDHFLAELPAKWQLSRIALVKGRPAGFWIASRKGRFLHTHRVGVSRQDRGRGIGRELFEKVRESGQHLGLEEMTLFVNVLNEEAKHFYEDLGFQRLSGERLEQFLANSGHRASAEGDRVEESGGYRYHIYALRI